MQSTLTESKMRHTLNDDNEVVLSVKNVSKRFCRDLKRSMYYGIQDIATEVVGYRNTKKLLRKGEFWALDDVSFELKQGAALGLVGANGAGKTTLLRIVSGLIKPDTGSVEVKGRVAPLIALGAGFNPILTGRENIKVNMSILGFSKEEIEERFEDVVAFSEIGEAIDSPLRSYSSGMAARLGFSSAIFTEPEILLIDEVLAVGDISFRRKCYNKLSELRDKGTSFILVSHNSSAIMNVCDEAILLDKGVCLSKGDSYLILNEYEEKYVGNKSSSTAPKLMSSTYVCGKEDLVKPTYIKSIFFKDINKKVVHQLKTGESVSLCIEVFTEEAVEDAGVHVKVRNEFESVLYISNIKDSHDITIKPGYSEISILMPDLSFKPGIYTATIWLRKGSLFEFDAVENFVFKVESSVNLSHCLFYQACHWSLDKKDKVAINALG